MRLFRKKAVQQTIEYDQESQIPILKCSICNGEQVAGFKDKKTGHFIEVMLIKNQNDLTTFMERFGISTISKERRDGSSFVPTKSR